MSKRILTTEQINEFKQYLYTEEKSRATIEKYMRDVTAFQQYTADTEVTKESVMAYKQKLIDDGYAVRSVNSMLASVNSLMAWLGWNDCKVKTIRKQRSIYCPETQELSREEYLRLVRTAQENNNMRLCLILQTICATGIRVSELEYITVEAAMKGEAVVSCKAKTRTVIIIKSLQKKLLHYAKKLGIEQGSIFITRNGRPVSRTNIWREMKSICKQANVNPDKVYPHNLRHLFARIFYQMEKDIAKLADILGHSSIDTTRIYIISTGSEHRKKMETMRLVI